MSDNTEHASDAPEAPPIRRAYVRPRLTTYGNVREFTRGGGGSKADKDGPSQL